MITLGFVASRPRERHLWDFGLFLLSGYESNHGVSPYGDELLATYASEFHVTLTAPYLNPPVTVLVFRPLAKLEPFRAFRIWWVLSLLLYGLCAAWLVYTGPGDKVLRGLWAFSLAALWMTQALGQIYVPLLALVILAYGSLGRGDLVGGVCVGLLAALKPNFLLWPALLLITGETVVAFTAFLVFGCAWMLPAVVFGPDIYRAWLGAVAAYTAPQLPTNASVTLWLSAFMPWSAVWIIATVAIVGCAAYLTKRRAPAPFCTDVALVLVIAASSIAWIGYMLLALPVFLRRTWSAPIMLSAALFTLPANALWQWWFNHPQDVFGPRMAYPLAVLLLLLGLIREGPAAEDRTLSRGSVSRAGVRAPAAPRACAAPPTFPTRS